MSVTSADHRRSIPPVTVARAHLNDPDVIRWYHCVTRCVRRAFLLGEGPEDRKKWIECPPSSPARSPLSGVDCGVRPSKIVAVGSGSRSAGNRPIDRKSCAICKTRACIPRPLVGRVRSKAEDRVAGIATDSPPRPRHVLRSTDRAENVRAAEHPRASRSGMGEETPTRHPRHRLDTTSVSCSCHNMSKALTISQ